MINKHIALLFILIVGLNACQDKSEVQIKKTTTLDESLLNSTSTDCEDDILKHITWIARGVPEVINSTDLKLKVEARFAINNDENYVSHSDAYDALVLHSGDHYDQETANSINNNFPNNDYDDDHFFSIQCSCIWETGILSPNYDDINTNSTIYVVPGVDGYSDETATAYYIDSTGYLDSIIVTDSFLDTHYIWIITSSPTCYDDGVTEQSKAFCNYDQICDDYEDSYTCPDCQTTGNNNNSLYLLEYETLTDYKGGVHPGNAYQEPWLARFYEICMQWVQIREGINYGYPGEYMILASERSSSNSDDLRAEGIIDLYQYDWFGLNRLKFHGKNAQVKRCKYKSSGGVKCNKGSHTTCGGDILLSNDYNPVLDIVDLVIYEEDPAGIKNPVSQRSYVQAEASSLVFGSASQVYREIVYNTKKDTYSHTNGNDIYRIDNNISWTQVVVGGNTWNVFETTFNGELRAKFGYIAN